jgi:hypothetical protein
VSRWVGVLEVKRGPFEDDTPIFYEQNDPFTLRFEVKAIAWLEKDKTIPIHVDEVWDALSFTRGHDKRSGGWTGPLRSSLRRMDESDGRFLENLILRQAKHGQIYGMDERDLRKIATHRVHGPDKVVSVSVPEENSEDEECPTPKIEGETLRESLKIQALIADIGSKMGFKIWIPRNDRARVSELMDYANPSLLETLPLNYDDTTLKTIELIDVLWLRGRAIVRAFEIEHTTSIYSGILRMADLLALQPNMDIKLHIVAPIERRDRVFTEIRRPVFSLLDRGPLAETCTFISYDSVKELSQQRHLSHFSNTVLDEYSEEAE